MPFFNLPAAFYFWLAGFMFTLGLYGSFDLTKRRPSYSKVLLPLLFMYLCLWLWPLFLGICLYGMYDDLLTALKEKK